MSKSVSLNYTDTAGGVAPTITMLAKNYGADFGLANNPGSSLCDIVNKTSPVDALNTERFGYRVVKDAYKGTGINEAYKSPNKQGFSIVSQCNIIATVVDSEDSTYRVDVPLSGHIVLSGGINPNITEAHLQAVVNRAFGGLYETTGASRLAELTRQIMKPADM